MSDEFEFKGSVMSIGSDCSVADMLSYIGVRESGALDWADNRGGMIVVADVLSGAMKMALHTRSFDWITREVETNDHPPRVQCIGSYHGCEFIHDDFMDKSQIEDQEWLCDKTVAFAEQGGVFVYLPSIEEEKNDLIGDFLVKGWFRDHDLVYEKQVLVLDKNKYENYFSLSITERIKLAKDLKKDLEWHFFHYLGKSLTLREDFIPNKMVGLKHE